MIKLRIPAISLLLVLLIGAAPLTASAPISALAAAATTVNSSSNLIKVQNMNVKMIFDGVSILPPQGQLVFIHNNTTYVPLRFMSYALQKSVVWDAKNLIVNVDKPNSMELVVIKEYLMNAANNNFSTSSKTVALNSLKVRFVFDSVAKTLPIGQFSYIMNGTLYVPLRFLSEAVGNVITWDQKTKTITAVSKDYGKQADNSNDELGPETIDLSPIQKGSSSETGKMSYEEITSSTEAELNALKNQSQSTLVSIAFEYLSAVDESSKASIKAKGMQQLSSFTASFNSIIAAAEQKLKANGYSTDIIDQYKQAFEADLQAGREIAEKLGNN